MTKKKKETTSSSQFPSLSLPRAGYRILGICYIAVLIGSLLLGLLLRTNTISLPFDRFFYELIYTMPHPQWLTSMTWFVDHNFLPILRPHPSFLVLTYVLFLGYMAIWRRMQLKWAFASLVLGLILIHIILFIDTKLVFRTRPFTILPNHVAKGVVGALKSWTSYPSGHSRDSMLVATIMSYFIPSLRYIFVFLALFVGFSRIYLGVHFPTDVLAGLLIGFLVGQITIRAVGDYRAQHGETHKSK